MNQFRLTESYIQKLMKNHHLECTGNEKKLPFFPCRQNNLFCHKIPSKTENDESDSLFVWRTLS
jgi:hypothetical protein